MINSFGDKDTEMIWNGKFSPKLPNEIQTIARRKLRMLNNAQNINDMRIPPANKLEKLRGNMRGYYSVRINRQWRITYKWINKNAEQVKIEDYHD
jgi:proteic killer suppression protein